MGLVFDGAGDKGDKAVGIYAFFIRHGVSRMLPSHCLKSEDSPL